MDVFKKHGTKDRLIEMFEKVNKVKVNENKVEKPLLEEGYNEWGLKIKKSRLAESFDSPKEKDEKYLDKAVDSAQDNKYDDGTRYPVEDKLKVNDPSLEKLKGDDKPIEKGAGEKTLDQIPLASTERVYEDEDDQDIANQDEPINVGDTEPISNNGEMSQDSFDADKEEVLSSEIGDKTPDGAMDAIKSSGEYGSAVVGNQDDPDFQDKLDQISTGDQINGGLADDSSVTDFDPEQITMGIKVEMEHTNDPKKALEIAMDHLVEIPDYYTRLAKMEDEAKAEGSFNQDAEAEVEDKLDGEPADTEDAMNAMGDEEEGGAEEEITGDENDDEEQTMLWGKENAMSGEEDETFNEGLNFKYKPRGLSEAIGSGDPFEEDIKSTHKHKETEPFIDEEKPSAGLSKEKKSDVVKKAKKGEDIGKKGKGFDAVADKAAKEYGSKEKGEKVAAAAMWKNIKR